MLPAPTGKIPANVVWSGFLGRKSARHRRGLHDANHRDHQRKWYKAADFSGARYRWKRQMRKRDRQCAQDTDTAALQVKQSNGDAGAEQAKKCPWNLGTDARGAERHDQDTGAQGERVEIGVPHMAQDVYQTGQKMAPWLDNAE